MQTVHRTPAIAGVATASREIQTELLIIPIFEDDTLADEKDLDAASGGDVAAARAR